MKEQPLAILTDHSPAIRRVRLGLMACVALLVLGGVMVALAVGNLRADLDAATADREQVKVDHAEQRAALNQANERLVDAGEKPVTTPPISGPQGVPGPQGAEGRDPAPRGPPAVA